MHSVIPNFNRYVKDLPRDKKKNQTTLGPTSFLFKPEEGLNLSKTMLSFYLTQKIVSLHFQIKHLTII